MISKFLRPRLGRYWRLKYRAESLVELTLCKSLIMRLPFQTWSWMCGHFQCETLRKKIDSDIHRLVSIRRSIEWAAKRVPWKSKCLDQALAAQRMLSRRKLESTLYLGLRKNEEKNWDAHAWVRCGDQWVIGYLPDLDYSVVGTYAKTL